MVLVLLLLVLVEVLLLLLVLLPLLLVVDCNNARRGDIKPPHTLQTSAQFVLRSIRTLRLTSFFFGLFAEKSPKHARLCKGNGATKTLWVIWRQISTCTYYHFDLQDFTLHKLVLVNMFLLIRRAL